MELPTIRGQEGTRGSDLVHGEVESGAPKIIDFVAGGEDELKKHGYDINQGTIQWNNVPQAGDEKASAPNLVEPGWFHAEATPKHASAAWAKYT
jgi:hypothetical protein